MLLVCWSGAYWIGMGIGLCHIYVRVYVIQRDTVVICSCALVVWSKNNKKCMVHASPWPLGLREVATVVRHIYIVYFVNRLTPNDPYMGRTAPLTSKHFILYIYSTNVGTEYFKHVLYSPFFSLQYAVCFMMLTRLVPVLFTFYTQGVLKLKKIIPAPKD